MEPRDRLATGAQLALAALASGMAACAVGPNYQRPEAASAIPAAYANSSGEWKVASPRDHLPKGSWWRVFGDAELDLLEADAAAANQELKAAAARFEQARATTDVARGGLFPSVGVSFQPSYQHDSINKPFGGKPGKTYGNIIVPLDLGYEIDLWGRVRRALEAATAQAQAVAADVEAVRLAMQAEVAADYFTLRALDAERQLLVSSIESYRKSLELTRNRRAGGLGSDLDVAQAETILKTAGAQLVDTALQRARFQNALAVLTGKVASLFRLPEQPLGQIAFAVPAALPSELLERRPDIAAAERRMAAANANIGVAEAAFFPTIRLGASTGFQSGGFDTLFILPSRFWAVGPSLSLPLFQGGRLRANLRQAQAVHEETIARYRQTVLAAFAEVESNLAAERLLAEEQEQETAALQASRRQLEIANNRYRSGLVTYLEVATAQNTSLTIERACARLRGQQVVTSVALIKALGGGWEMPPG